jgi:hypothetical protein
MGEPREREAPEEAPKHTILRLTQQYGVRKVEVWVKQAAKKVEAEARSQKEQHRREEIRRLQAVADQGEKAKKRIRELERESDA